MPGRCILASLAAGVLALTTPLLQAEPNPSASAASQQKPNVVLILADDLGFGTVSAYGGQQVDTPHIDSLAEQGVRFTQAYVTAPLCSPSRAGLITGRYQQRLGFDFNVGPFDRALTEPLGLDPGARTFGDVFAEAGYVTGMVGKWHLGVQDQFLPNGRGFSRFFGFLPGDMCYLPCSERGEPIERSIFSDTTPVEESEYLTDAFAREASAFIDRHAGEPFLLYVPFNAVHTPLEATDEYLDRFPDVEDASVRTYLAMVSALDDAVGQILAAIHRNGLDDRTLIVFASDNGAQVTAASAFGANGSLRFGKFYLFEGGIRVPLLIRWPGAAPGGATFDRPVSTLDILPTMLGAAGISRGGLDGVDLLPFVAGELAGRPHRYLFWRVGDSTAAVRDRDWKLIRSEASRWLYNLSTDPGETRNLANDRPDLVTDLQERLDVWMSRLPSPVWGSHFVTTSIIDGQRYRVER